MCEFCSKHGDGKIWFENARNYAADLLSDLGRRNYIGSFFTATIDQGIQTIGRLEALYVKKKRLPARLVEQMVARAREEHFGQVVTLEDLRKIIGKAATVVRLPCACRWAALKRENRCCYSVSYTPEAWYQELDMGYFGLPQDQGLESVSQADALAQMEALEGKGAIHTIWTMKTPFIGAICNCRPTECLGLRSLAIGAETMFRGEQAAQVDSSRCTGCGLCANACSFKAISSQEISGAYRAAINAHLCFGCGLCANACPESAIAMVPRLAP